MKPGVGDIVDGIERVNDWYGGRGGARVWSFMPMDMRERQKRAWVWRVHLGRLGMVAVDLGVNSRGTYSTSGYWNTSKG